MSLECLQLGPVSFFAQDIHSGTLAHHGALAARDVLALPRVRSLQSRRVD